MPNQVGTARIGSWRALAGFVLAVALVAVSCGNAASVAAKLKDFSISLDPASASAGTVAFEITNDGPSTHEFVVFRTDLAPTALPTGDDGTVDEQGEGVTLVDEVEDIESGATPALEVDLEAGAYVVICNIVGHYASGMAAGFTIE